VNTTRIALFALATFALPNAPRAEEMTTNQPPRFEYSSYDEGYRVRVGNSADVTLEAKDPENDPVTFRVTGAPQGMVSMSGGKGILLLHWKPRKGDLGPHEVFITATDSHGGVAEKSITILVEDDWRSYFMPGASYVTQTPVDRATWGVFQGVSAQILLASWIHRNENRGPSHGRVYLDMDLLRSSNPGTNAAFDFAMGFDLSIERNPVRHFLLPYFGMKSGAFIHRDLDRGSVWHVTPLAGAYLYADKNFFLTASAGYVLPISAARFDELRGFRGSIGANFSLW
jgi:hypothetical protein